jgi:hypothetical protein
MAWISPTSSRGVSTWASTCAAARAAKPNMVSTSPAPPSTRIRSSSGGAAVACRRRRDRSDRRRRTRARRDIEYLVTATGLADQLKDQTPFRRSHEDDVRMVQLASIALACSNALPASSRADYVISMPKLKTHHWGCMMQPEEPVWRRPWRRLRLAKNVLHARHPSVHPRSGRHHSSATRDCRCGGGHGSDGPIIGRPRPSASGDRRRSVATTMRASSA